MTAQTAVPGADDGGEGKAHTRPGVWPSEHPALTSPRLLLRPLHQTDADRLFAISRDPEIPRLTHWTPWTSLDEVSTFITDTQAAFLECRAIAWGVHHRRDDRLIGTCTLHVSLGQRLAELGYTIAREYRRRGLATEAARSATTYAFEMLALDRVEAICDVENAGSLRLLEQLGMRREGVHRDRVLPGEEYRDVALYAVLAAEWRAMRS